MAEGNNKQYDLEERTCELARDVRAFVRQLPQTLSNIADKKELEAQRNNLIQEATELMNMFGAIFRKSE